MLEDSGCLLAQNESTLLDNDPVEEFVEPAACLPEVTASVEEQTGETEDATDDPVCI